MLSVLQKNTSCIVATNDRPIHWGLIEVVAWVVGRYEVGEWRVEYSHEIYTMKEIQSGFTSGKGTDISLGES